MHYHFNVFDKILLDVSKSYPYLVWNQTTETDIFLELFFKSSKKHGIDFIFDEFFQITVSALSKIKKAKYVPDENKIYIPWDYLEKPTIHYEYPEFILDPYAGFFIGSYDEVYMVKFLHEFSHAICTHTTFFSDLNYEHPHDTRWLTIYKKLRRCYKLPSNLSLVQLLTSC